MGKCSNTFSETTNMIKATLYMNVPWMGLYKLGFLFRYEIQNGGYGRPQFNSGPYGKMFQNASLKPLGQLKPNCPGIIIWRSSKNFGFFMLIRNPSWLILISTCVLTNKLQTSFLIEFMYSYRTVVHTNIKMLMLFFSPLFLPGINT